MTYNLISRRETVQENDLATVAPMEVAPFFGFSDGLRQRLGKLRNASAAGPSMFFRDSPGAPPQKKGGKSALTKKNNQKNIAAMVFVKKDCIFAERNVRAWPLLRCIDLCGRSKRNKEKPE